MPEESIKIFISHASESKDSIARPLAQTLIDVGFSVWYDEYSIGLGDSIFRSINRGLSCCDVGVVIFCPFFFNKEWTQHELAGLFQSANTKIIPVFHGVELSLVREKAPIVADRLGIDSGGLEVEEIARRLRDRIMHDNSGGGFVYARSSIDETIQKKNEEILNSSLETEDMRMEAFQSDQDRVLIYSRSRFETLGKCEEYEIGPIMFGGINQVISLEVFPFRLKVEIARDRAAATDLWISLSLVELEQRRGVGAPESSLVEMKVFKGFIDCREKVSWREADSGKRYDHKELIEFGLRILNEKLSGG